MTLFSADRGGRGCLDSIMSLSYRASLYEGDTAGGGGGRSCRA